MVSNRWIVALGVTPTLLLFLGCLNTDNGLVVVDGKVEFLVVEADGGGWGASKLAREAIESLDVAHTLYMSGKRATFTVRRGTNVTKDQVVAALKARGMKLESFQRELRVRPRHAYVATVTGLGWVQKAKRVRATLVELEGVRDVFVDKEIGFHVEKGVTLDSKRLNQLLQKEGVVVEKISRGDGYIL